MRYATVISVIFTIATLAFYRFSRGMAGKLRQWASRRLERCQWRVEDTEGRLC